MGVLVPRRDRFTGTSRAIPEEVFARMRGRSNSEILEAGLILVVLISIVSVGPASWVGSTNLMREHTYQLVFAALATGLCIFERSHVERTQAAEPSLQPVVDAPATQAAPRLHV